MPSSGVQTCARSEEHTSELQSHSHLVCRLLLEKKKTQHPIDPNDDAVPTVDAAHAHQRSGGRALADVRLRARARRYDGPLPASAVVLRRPQTDAGVARAVGTGGPQVLP